MSESTPPPLVTIALPVFNEARHIDEALHSLRAQDYPRLEIIVCDNASDDDTVAICRKHADADPRIRIEVASANVGASANFQRAFEFAKGDFFMWASGHDLWSPSLVSECTALLLKHPGASLAYASCDWIGDDGDVLDIHSGWTDTRSMAPASRFFTIFWGNMHPVLGVMRSESLRACGPLLPVVGGDLLLLSDLALRGDFLHAPHSRWCRREVRIETSYQDKLKRYSSPKFGITRSRVGRAFPLLALPWELAKRVARAPMPAVDRCLMLAALLPSLALRYLVGRRGKQA